MNVRLPLLDRLRLSRTDEPELLDGDALDATELHRNLRELAMLNRLPGGAGASIAAVERLADGRSELSIADVGTGAGDLPVAFARHGRGRGRWTVVAIEVRPEIAAFARRRTARLPEITVQLGDATRLPFADRSFDVAHSSLLLHHLDGWACVEALTEMRRVSRLGVVVNDLQRGRLHFLVTAATVRALARSRYTRHDGVVSARRAYTLTERRELLRSAGLRPVWQTLPLAPRVATAAVAIDR